MHKIYVFSFEETFLSRTFMTLFALVLVYIKLTYQIQTIGSLDNGHDLVIPRVNTTKMNPTHFGLNSGICLR